MQPVALTLVALIAGGAVVFVAWPFLRASPGPRSRPQGEPATDLGLLEQRDRALAALKELEFDHRTGKVSDDDYRALVVALRLEAAQTLRQLSDRHGRRSPPRRVTAEPPSTQSPLAAAKTGAE